MVKKIETEYDPVLHRYRAFCPACHFQSVRAKREAATHIVAQHAAYEHGMETK